MQSTRKRPRLSFLDCGEGEGEEGREDSEGSTRDLDKDSWPLSDSKNVRGGSTADEGNSPAPLDLFSTYSFAGVGEDEKVPSSAAELGRRQDGEARAEAACFQASSKNCVEDLLFGSTADGTRTSSARGEASLEADAAGFSFETDAALIDSLLAGSCEDELLPKDTHDQSLSSSSSSGTSSSSAPNSVGSAAHRPYRSPSSALLQSPSTRPPGESASARAAIGDCVAGDARNSGSYSLPGENEAAESSLVSTLARRSASDICAQEEVLVADDSSSLFCPPTMPEIQNVVASAHMSWRADGVDMWTGPDTNSRLDLRLLAISCRFAEYNPRKINACILRLRAPKCTALVFRSGRVMITGARSETEAEKAARLLSRILTFAYCGDPAANTAPSLKTSFSGTAPALPSSLSSFSAPSSCPLVEGDKQTAVEQRESDGPRAESHDPTQSSSGVKSPLLCTAIVPFGGLPEAEGGNVGATERRKSRQKTEKGRKLCVKNFKVENVVASADCGVPVRLEGLAFEHKEFSSYEPELFSGLVYRYNPTPSLKAVLLVFVSGKVVITGCKKLSEVNEVFEALYPVLVRYRK